MASATFLDLVASRDVLFTDDTYYAPGATPCPNGDPAQIGNGTPGAAAYRDDTPGDFMIPWGVSDWTFELWLYRTVNDVSTERFAVYCNTTFSGQFPWMLNYNGSNVALILEDTSAAIIATADIAQAGVAAWGHYVWTVNSSLGTGAAAGRRIKRYKNGTTAGSDVAFTTAFTTATPSSARLWLPRTASAHWEMAKFAIYHRELTSTEILDHYDVMTT